MQNDDSLNSTQVKCPGCGSGVSTQFPFCPFCKETLGNVQSVEQKREIPKKPGIPKNCHRFAHATFQEAYQFLKANITFFALEIAVLVSLFMLDSVLSIEHGQFLNGIAILFAILILYVLFCIPFIVSIQIVKDSKTSLKAAIRKLIDPKLIWLFVIIYFFANNTIGILYYAATISEDYILIKVIGLVGMILVVPYFSIRALLSVLIQCVSGRSAGCSFRMARKMYIGNELNVVFFVGKITFFMLVLAVGNSFADFSELVELGCRYCGGAKLFPQVVEFFSNMARTVIYLLLYQMTALVLTVFFRDSGGFLLSEENHWKQTWAETKG